MHGADVWDLGEELKIAARGGLLIAANSEARVEDALKRAAGDGAVLLSDELLEAHGKTLDRDAFEKGHSVHVN